jgi:ABC-2 type transport system permease protein
MTFEPVDRIDSRFQPRRYGAVNWLGLQTLVTREIMRFMKVSAQTVIAPLISTLLFLAVFALAFGDRPWGTTNLRYVDGVTAGLVMMAVISNSFQNASSSIVIAKVQGNAVDFLMPPISALELATAFIVGAAARGMIVGVASLVAASPFAHVTPANFIAAVYFALMGSIIFGAIGLLGGIWAEKFDNIAAISNFVVTPLTFLSGTFYSVEKLPEPFRTICHYNPVFSLIDGFRASMIGHADFPVGRGALIVGAMAAALCWACWAMLKSGYRLRQ